MWTYAWPLITIARIRLSMTFLNWNVIKLVIGNIDLKHTEISNISNQKSHYFSPVFFVLHVTNTVTHVPRPSARTFPSRPPCHRQRSCPYILRLSSMEVLLHTLIFFSVFKKFSWIPQLWRAKCVSNEILTHIAVCKSTTIPAAFGCILENWPCPVEYSSVGGPPTITGNTNSLPKTYIIVYLYSAFQIVVLTDLIIAPTMCARSCVVTTTVLLSRCRNSWQEVDPFAIEDAHVATANPCRIPHYGQLCTDITQRSPWDTEQTNQKRKQTVLCVLTI